MTATIDATISAEAATLAATSSNGHSNQPVPVLSAAPSLTDPYTAQALASLQAVETDIRAILMNRDQVIRGSLVAMLAGEHIFLLGPPGTAKTQLMNSIAMRLHDPLTPGRLPVFARLLTKYTSPSELFGPLSVKGLENDVYRYITTGKLPEAYFVLLDELYKAGSAILNTLLQIFNERVYNDGTEDRTVPLITAFCAGNELPEDPTLAPIHDRLLLQYHISYLPTPKRHDMLVRRAAVNLHKMTVVHQSRAASIAGLPYTPTPSGVNAVLSIDELFHLQQIAAAVYVPPTVIDQMTQLGDNMSKTLGIVVSDRRWDWIVGALRAHALIEGRLQVDEDDLSIMADCLWQRPDQHATILREINRLVSPVNAKATEIADSSAKIIATLRTVFGNTSATETEKTQASIDATTKLRAAIGQVQGLLKDAESRGMNVTKVQRALDQVSAFRSEAIEILTNAGAV